MPVSFSLTHGDRITRVDINNKTFFAFWFSSSAAQSRANQANSVLELNANVRSCTIHEQVYHGFNVHFTAIVKVLDYFEFSTDIKIACLLLDDKMSLQWNSDVSTANKRIQSIILAEGMQKAVENKEVFYKLTFPDILKVNAANYYISNRLEKPLLHVRDKSILIHKDHIRIILRSCDVSELQIIHWWKAEGYGELVPAVVPASTGTKSIEVKEERVQGAGTMTAVKVVDEEDIKKDILKAHPYQDVIDEIIGLVFTFENATKARQAKKYMEENSKINRWIVGIGSLFPKGSEIVFFVETRGQAELLVACGYRVEMTWSSPLDPKDSYNSTKTNLAPKKEKDSSSVLLHLGDTQETTTDDEPIAIKSAVREQPEGPDTHEHTYARQPLKAPPPQQSFVGSISSQTRSSQGVHNTDDTGWSHGKFPG